MTANEIIARMPAAAAGELLGHVLEKEKPLYKATIETLAKQRKLRPIFVERKPRAERHAWMKDALGRKQNESVAAHLLQIWLVGEHAKLLCDFLDGLGIKHDENGTIEELPPSPAREKLLPVIDQLLEKHDAAIVRSICTLFRRSMNRLDELAEIVDTDPRLQFAASSNCLKNQRLASLRKAQLRRAVEPLGKIDRVAEIDFARIDLIGPDAEMNELRAAVNRRKRAIHRVEAARDFDPADAGDVEARIKSVPAMADVDLKIGVEIHRRAGILKRHVGHVAGDVARRNIKRPAKRDRQHARNRGRRRSAARWFRDAERARVARAEAVFDIFMHPIADRLHAVQAVRHVAEVLEGKVEQLVRIAVSARKRVAKQVRGQLLHRHRLVDRAMILAHRRHGDERVVPDRRAADGQIYAMNDVAVLVLVFERRKFRTKNRAALFRCTATGRGAA